MVPSQAALLEALGRLELAGIACALFVEPDDAMGATALCTARSGGCSGATRSGDTPAMRAPALRPTPLPPSPANAKRASTLVLARAWLSALLT